MCKMIFQLLPLLFFTNVAMAQLKYNYTPYSIQSLHNFPFQSSPISLTKVIEESAHFTIYQGTYTTMRRKMSLYVGVPKLPSNQLPSEAIILLRDFQHHLGYSTGQAVDAVAKEYLLAGFVVVAPDFFGFAQSDAPPIGEANSIESYLIMPVNAAELYFSLANNPIITSTTLSGYKKPILPDHFSLVALWGLGNGGLVALQTLAITQEPIPTILWAPVTQDFLHAWAFFRSSYSDIAKRNANRFVDDFQRHYQLKSFSLSDNLQTIAPKTLIVLHHGTQDDTIPIGWSEQFQQKINQENSKRNDNRIEPIRLRYNAHTDLGHNLEASRSQLVTGDILLLRSLHS
jgi:hypothetical protein